MSKRKYVSHYEGPRTQDLATPKAFFDRLNRKYAFTLDGAAHSGNALLPRFTAVASAETWGGERVFCNPPWSNIAHFLEFGSGAELAVMLVPARVNAKWFHRALKLKAKPKFFQGKLCFGNSKWNSPVDCLLLVFGRARRSSR